MIVSGSAARTCALKRGKGLSDGRAHERRQGNRKWGSEVAIKTTPPRAVGPFWVWLVAIALLGLDRRVPSRAPPLGILPTV